MASAWPRMRAATGAAASPPWAHMPAAHRAHLEWTPQRLIDWGQRIGVACGELVSGCDLAGHPEHGYRSCLGLLSLSRRYGKVRLEAACATCWRWAPSAIAMCATSWPTTATASAKTPPVLSGQVPHTRMCAVPATTGDSRPALDSTESTPSPCSTTPPSPSFALSSSRASPMPSSNSMIQADCLGLSFDERLALLVEREVCVRGDRKRSGWRCSVRS